METKAAGLRFIREIDGLRYFAQNLLVTGVPSTSKRKQNETKVPLPSPAGACDTQLQGSQSQEGQHAEGGGGAILGAWLVQGPGRDSQGILVRHTSDKGQGAETFSESRNLDGQAVGSRRAQLRPPWVRASFSFHVWIKAAPPWSPAQGKKGRSPVVCSARGVPSPSLRGPRVAHDWMAL